MRRIAFIVFVMSCVMASRAFCELSPEEKAQIDALIQRMGDRDFAVREEATKKLIEMGPDVLPVVRKTLEATDDPEIRLRCGRVLRGVKLTERVLRDYGAKPDSFVQLMMNANRKTVIFRVRREGKLVLIHDGKESAGYDGFREYYLTNDPERVAYMGMIDKKYHVVIDDKVAEHEYAGHIRVSEDGKHVGYLARRGDDEKKYFMVLDGKELPEYDSLWGITFAGDYLISGAKKGERWVFAVNGSESPAHDKVFPADPHDAPRYVAIDGREVWLCRPELPAKGEPLPEKLKEVRVKRLALLDEEWAKQDIYVDRATTHDVLLHGRTMRDCRVFMDGKLVGVFQGHNGGTPSPDGERLAVIASRPGAYHVLYEDKDLGPYDVAQNLTWSPDGKNVAFCARRGGSWFLVCDGKEGEGVSMPIGRIVFSPDGKHVAAQAGGGGASWAILRDGKVVGRYSERGDGSPDGLGGFELRRQTAISASSPAIGKTALAFSPDGEHLAWVGARDGGLCIVVDGREGPPYESIEWIRFSSDGKHLCYLAKRRDEGDGAVRSRMVVDNIEAPPSEEIHNPHSKYPLDRLTYVTLSADNHFKLVEIPWPKSFDWTNGLKSAPEK